MGACRVQKANMILGEGRGFEIAQGRLGPGRLHHCMRAIGIGEAALAYAARRVQQRATFGAKLAQSPLVQAQLADAWIELHGAWYDPRIRAQLCLLVHMHQRVVADVMQHTGCRHTRCRVSR